MAEFARFCAGVAADQRAIWTSPVRGFPEHRAEWLGFAAVTAVLFLADRRITAALPRSRREITASRWASRAGTVYTAGLAVLGPYAAGRKLRHPRLREFGLLGMRTVCDTELLGNPLKFLTQRPRPTEKGGGGRFFQGGYGFPSGHSMKTWALAAVVAREFPESRLAGAAAYCVAATVSLSRLFGFRHFAADAFAGAVMGWYVGVFVQTRHHASAE